MPKLDDPKNLNVFDVGSNYFCCLILLSINCSTVGSFFLRASTLSQILLSVAFLVCLELLKCFCKSSKWTLQSSQNVASLFLPIFSCTTFGPLENMVKASGHSFISKTSGLKHSVLSTTLINGDRSFRISVWTGPPEIFFTGEEYDISLLFDKKKTLISSKETMLMANLFAFSKIPSLLCSLVALWTFLFYLTSIFIPSHLVHLSQNLSHENEFDLHRKRTCWLNSFSYERFSTKTRFDRKVKR